MEVQARYLTQLRGLVKATSEKILVIAGDLFDKWSVQPEVISLALWHLEGSVYAVPGQHDLPFHRYFDRHLSAYGTVTAAGILKDLTPGNVRAVPGFRMVGYPWGFEPQKTGLCGGVNLAVCHAYCWVDGHAHPGAEPSAYCTNMQRKFEGYTTVVFGDNHSGFFRAGTPNKKLPNVFNCGTFIRRHSTDKDYSPHVGLLLKDGSVLLHHLNTSDDKWDEKFSSRVEDAKAEGVDLDAVVQMAESIADGGLNFLDAVRVALEDKAVRTAVKEMVREAIEEASS
jgi:hypothetical protein